MNIFIKMEATLSLHWEIFNSKFLLYSASCYLITMKLSTNCTCA